MFLNKKYILVMFGVMAAYLMINNAFSFLLIKKDSNRAQANHSKPYSKSFCVISTVFNPVSYSSRFTIYKSFEKHMRSFGVRLITVELAIGNQQFAVTQPNNTNHIQLRTDDILWYKENLINIGAKHSPIDCRYLAWIDADMEFINLNWVEDTVVALRSHKVVQLFENVVNMGPNGKILQVQMGLSKCAIKARTCAPGGAWATLKSRFSSFGGLWDIDIVGDSDGIFGRACYGLISDGLSEKYQPDYLNAIQKWQLNLYRHINGSVTHIRGNISHIWHGSRKNRGYMKRKKIVNSQTFPFKPIEHVFYDINGLLHFKPKVRKHFMNLTSRYFLYRDEDSKITENTNPVTAQYKKKQNYY